MSPRRDSGSSLGEEVDPEVDVRDVRDFGVAVSGHVLAPIILFLFLGRASLVSPVPPASASQMPEDSGRTIQGGLRSVASVVPPWT